MTFTYTSTGQVQTATDNSEGMTYTYDELDRIVDQDNPDGSSLHYEYDPAGNLAGIQSQTAAAAPSRQVSHTYDALNRLQTVSDQGGSSTTYHYDPNGNRIRVDYPNGTSTLYSYDTLNRLIEIEHVRGATTLARFTYTLNAVGDRTRVDNLDGSSSEFQYDDLRRLTREIHRNSSGAITSDLSYAYDAVGNRLAEINNLIGATTTYSYDSADRMLSKGASTFAYDANGNLVAKTDSGTVTSYAYDFENRMVQIDRGGDQTLYSYDYLGNRTAATTGSGVTRYLVATVNNTGLSQVLEEYAPGGDAQVSYVYGDDLISQDRSGGESFFHIDGVNSTRLLSDDAGNVTDTYTYSAFGTLTDSTGSTVNNYLFSGEQLDPNSGFYHLRARFYAPALGRFITTDPFEGFTRDPKSLHKYLYANQNPVGFADPTGLFTLPEGIAVGALTSVLITGVTIAIDLNDPVKRAELTGGRIIFKIVTAAVVGGITGGIGSVVAGSVQGPLGTGQVVAAAGLTQKLFERLVVSTFAFGGASVVVGAISGGVCVLEAVTFGAGSSTFGGELELCALKAGLSAALFWTFGSATTLSGLDGAFLAASRGSAAAIASALENIKGAVEGAIEEIIASRFPDGAALTRYTQDLLRGTPAEPRAAEVSRVTGTIGGAFIR